MRPVALAVVALFLASSSISAEVTLSKDDIVDSIVHGGGLLPGQDPGPSENEIRFRAEVEARKDAMLDSRVKVEHPAMRTEADWERARQTVAKADWAREWYEEEKEIADYVVAQTEGYIEHMIPERTPWAAGGFTCPNCVGRLSQVSSLSKAIEWDYHNPDVIRCGVCGQTYPDPAFPEDATLQAPRSGQTFTYYLNPEEKAHPEDRTGDLAWRWIIYPTHVTFEGQISAHKVRFMLNSLRSLGRAYGLTGDPKYAECAADILVRFAQCYRHWLYHDYYGAIADCDPLYAAWHPLDRIEWKRHLSAEVYEKDAVDEANMLQTYWGAGRFHPGIDGIGSLNDTAEVYDLIYNATGPDGRPVLSGSERETIERDLFLEWVIGAEPFLGGRGEAKETNNKSPRAYCAMASIARIMGVVEYADVALRGYEAIRDEAFLYDGFSRESAGYTTFYLSALLQIPTILDEFTFPETGSPRTGTVRVFETDPKLDSMFHAVVDHLRPDGRYLPFDDTQVGGRPIRIVLEMGLRHFPEYYRGRFPFLMDGRPPTEYSLFNNTLEDLSAEEEFNPPEIYFPAWMTPILRHGTGSDAAAMAINSPPPGGHRTVDMGSLFYADHGRTILGDNGYCGGNVAHLWNFNTQSHNLVVVDATRHAGFWERVPTFHRYVSTPGLTVTEVSSASAYFQCSEYRRLVALVKGPGNKTFGLDVFKVAGGDRHDYRIFSELGTSEDPDNLIAFSGVDLPVRGPLVNVGPSQEREWYFGLRNTVTDTSPPPAWQAIWSTGNDAYRLWMLTQGDEVSVSDMPAQQIQTYPGRRVHVVDTTNLGHDVESLFVAVHEPDNLDGTWNLRNVERIPLPPEAGPNAAAVHVVADWGDYYFFVHVDSPVRTAGIEFQGAFGAVCKPVEGSVWIMGSEASILTVGGKGVIKTQPVWTGTVTDMSSDYLETDTERPQSWPEDNSDIMNHVLVNDGRFITSFPVTKTESHRITTKRFPLQPTDEFDLPVAFYKTLAQ